MNKNYYKKLPEGWENFLSEIILRVRKNIFLGVAITEIEGEKYFHLYSVTFNYIIPIENYENYLKHLFGNSYIFIRNTTKDIMYHSRNKKDLVRETLHNLCIEEYYIIKDFDTRYYELLRVTTINDFTTENIDKPYYIIVVIDGGSVRSYIFYTKKKGVSDIVKNFSKHL